MRKVMVLGLVAVAILALGSVAIETSHADPPARTPTNTSGVWLDVGHEECAPDRICADWFAYPDGVAGTTCCIPTAMVGSNDYSACSDFREVHGSGQQSGHEGDP